MSYSLLILSTNSSGVSISILEKPNHFLPKSLMDAPMLYTQFAALLFFYFICHIYIHFSKITNCDFEHYHI